MTTEQLKTLTNLKDSIARLDSAIGMCDANITQLRNRYTPSLRILRSDITDAISYDEELEMILVLKNQLLAIKAPLDAEFASFILSKPV